MDDQMLGEQKNKQKTLPYGSTESLAYLEI
jgi:hypothetical protein